MFWLGGGGGRSLCIEHTSSIFLCLRDIGITKSRKYFAYNGKKSVAILTKLAEQHRNIMVKF